MASANGTLAKRETNPHGPIRTFGLGTRSLSFVPPQPVGWSFLVWARSGALTVRTAGRLALGFAGSAVWIPAGTTFGIESRADCDLRVAYVDRDVVPPRPFGSVVASPLLREILERSVVAGYLDPSDARHARLIAVALDELAALEPAPSALAMSLPIDARMRAAVERTWRIADDVPTVPELAFAAGMTLRTFERRFALETGLTPRAWLRRARLHAGVLALAAGAGVTEAGLVAGYASLSAFIAACRSDFGRTPGRLHDR
jgi:AraC-like DNA-binding protein